MATATNRYVGVSGAAPVLAQIEETAVSWLSTLMGLPAGSGGVLTSGGSLSSFCALVTAREERLDEDFRDAVIYFSEETHHCVPKAARLAGFPRASLRTLPTDERFRLVPEALDAAVREDRARGGLPFAVVAMAGTTSSNAIDPLAEITAIARQEALWLHVDAAYAGSAALVPELRPLFAGWEAADSIVENPHKWLFTPMDASLLLTRRMPELRAAFSLVPEYLRTSDPSGVHNLMDTGIQLGRRFRSLKLWMILRYFGADGLRARIAEHVRLARLFGS